MKRKRSIPACSSGLQRRWEWEWEYRNNMSTILDTGGLIISQLNKLVSDIKPSVPHEGFLSNTINWLMATIPTTPCLCCIFLCLGWAAHEMQGRNEPAVAVVNCSCCNNYCCWVWHWFVRCLSTCITISTTPRPLTFELGWRQFWLRLQSLMSELHTKMEYVWIDSTTLQRLDPSNLSL